MGQRALDLDEAIEAALRWSSDTVHHLIGLGHQRPYLQRTGDPAPAARRALLAVEAVEARAAELDAVLARLRAAAEAVDA